MSGTWKWFEFPVTDPTFDGGEEGSQGPDRVVAISRNIGQGGTRSFTYCLALTHRDEEVSGALDPCAVVGGGMILEPPSVFSTSNLPPNEAN